MKKENAKKLRVNKMTYLDLKVKEEMEEYCLKTGYGFSELIEMMWAIHKKKYK
jgi:hypothetical protein